MAADGSSRAHVAFTQCQRRRGLSDSLATWRVALALSPTPGVSGWDAWFVQWVTYRNFRRAVARFFHAAKAAAWEKWRHTMRLVEAVDNL